MASDPILMGIVNVTPDSFSDGGQFDSVNRAVAHGMALVEEGAHILDIGGESTRPGADEVSVAQEIDRTAPVIAALAERLKSTPTRLSIDTRKPEVARAAARAGAHIWNDVSALTFSPQSLAVAADLGLDVVLMHSQGDPKTMQQNPQYGDVVEEVYAFLKARIDACVAMGISREKLVADPGIGFGKTVPHNLKLLSKMKRFTALGVPLMLGASRKSFIAKVDREEGADHRLGGSLTAAITAFDGGATWFRVHDVAQTRQALALFQAIKAAE
ncbi:MAG: dihydropteroate synthase [Pseudomonadota bacterium]